MVTINDMEMPVDCIMCAFLKSNGYTHGICGLNGEQINSLKTGERNEKCPLRNEKCLLGENTAHWIKEYDKSDWESRLISCICSSCKESALLKKDVSMDGISYKLCPSKFCPHCGKKMEK